MQLFFKQINSDGFFFMSHKTVNINFHTDRRTRNFFLAQGVLMGKSENDFVLTVQAKCKFTNQNVW